MGRVYMRSFTQCVLIQYTVTLVKYYRVYINVCTMYTVDAQLFSSFGHKNLNLFYRSEAV